VAGATADCTGAQLFQRSFTLVHINRRYAASSPRAPPLLDAFTVEEAVNPCSGSAV
jgi:hypothetical protein